MEQHSQKSSSQNEDDYQALLAQLRESYGRVAYSHKTHEKCCDIYYSRLKLLKNTQIILSAITTGGLIATLLGNKPTATIIATTTSTILLALTTYIKESEIGELVQKHKQTASELWGIRESYLSLMADILDHPERATSIREQRDKLQIELENIYKTAPRTTKGAYIEAQKALKLNEELTFSESEIDKMLPEKLRMSKAG